MIHCYLGIISYTEVGEGKCASDWGNDKWILTAESASATDRGIEGQNLAQCKIKCSSLPDCNYIVYSGSETGRKEYSWCYLWSEETCTPLPHHYPYKIYKKDKGKTIHR